MAPFGKTTYNWRPDVADEVRTYLRLYNITANTYEDHPPGLGLDRTSVDFWGPQGRGDPVSNVAARKVMRRVRRRFRSHPWRWMIHNNKGYYPDGGSFTPPGGREWNFGHVHVTYR